MYEARQNKEKVSRRIDGSGGARQRILNTSKNIILSYQNPSNCRIIQQTKEDAQEYIQYNNISINPINRNTIISYIEDSNNDLLNRFCLQKSWNHNNNNDPINISLENIENIDDREVPNLVLYNTYGGVSAIGYMDVHFKERAYFQTEFATNGPYQRYEPRYYKRFATEEKAGGDAEVKLLSAINVSLNELCKESFYNQKYKKYSWEYNRTKITGIIIIKISKGPCSSCRKVISQFHKDYPQIKLIIRYTQSQAQQFDSASHSGQLGYKNAQRKDGRFWEVAFPAKKLNSI